MKIEVVHYSEPLKPHFKSLNLEWLNKYYTPTVADLLILDHPEDIVSKGGQVFFALGDGVVAGTCAVVLHQQNSYELIKMGVTAAFQGRGIANTLMQAVIEEAKKKGIKKITLETAASLKAAISLYKKTGFVQSSPEEVHPDFGRLTFKMELNLD